MHDVPMSPSTDFYEEDEPVAEIRAAFERGEKGKTGPPLGQTEDLWPGVNLWQLPTLGWTRYLAVPDVALLTAQSETPTATVSG